TDLAAQPALLGEIGEFVLRRACLQAAERSQRGLNLRVSVNLSVHQLREMGVKLSVDDFGTGHSSLSHIMDYPLDCIKLDCDFVQRMNTEPAILAIVESIGILGQKLSIDIIAEGVETEQQR
ncbi:EAL domain-containing protein, partial [Pseudomonas aeruginosa]